MFSSDWLGFAAALLIEIVVLGVPCVAVAPRASREWLARLTNPSADVRLGWSEWAALVGGSGSPSPAWGCSS